MAKSLVLVAAVLALWGVLSAPVALAVGMVLALANLAAYQVQAKKLSRQLIQASIVLLGFSIPLSDVAKAGLSGLALSAGAIVLVFGAAAVLARVLGVQDKMAALLASGTAICGGSAIAATSGVIGAAAAETAVATAVIFLLNAVGVYVYPVIGHALEMTDAQFGSWAAIGVHDVAGVVAAGKAYSDAAADQATIIKLTRVLWIVPVAFALAWWVRRGEAAAGGGGGGGGASAGLPDGGKQAKVGAPIPWFILWFLVACALRSFVPVVSTSSGVLQDVAIAVRDGVPWLAPRWVVDAAAGAGGVSAASLLRGVGKALLTVALLLIGLGLSREALRQVGSRALALGVSLWILVSVASLLVVRLL